MTMAPMPMRQLSPTVQLWSTTLWPTLTPLPSDMLRWLLVWRVELS